MAYITIPKALMGPAYSAVSPTAKLLYGLLSDRSSLSKRNGDIWKTPTGEVFVYYPISEICKTLRCGHDKAAHLLRELTEAGLIRRIRQGQGKPDKIIVSTALQNSESKPSRLRTFGQPDRDKYETNKPNTIKPDSINPDLSHLHGRNALEAMIRDNICYDILNSKIEETFINCVVSTMVDAIYNPAPVMQIAGMPRTREEIYHRLMSVNEMHVQYVYDRTRSMTRTIQYPRAYILACLFHAADEMDIYYESRISYDERRNREVSL